ncbi:MAG TPA: sortase [Anaerolineales bacterium]|nr:sortase [Anaerolineales bacterium]
MQAFILRFVSVLLVLSLLLIGQGARPVYAQSYQVNSPNDDTTKDGSCTLREAILAANNDPSYTTGDCGSASPGNDTITFSASITTITLSSPLPSIVNAGALTIDGGGDITISGDGSVRVMYVNSGATLTLQNLTIANGSAVNGGGVYNDGGTLTITGSTFSGNSAGGFGGGVYNDGGTLTITNSTFSNNIVSYDGGGVYNAGTLNVTNSTFSDNSVVYDGDGGGVYNVGTLTITNSTFSGNSATFLGGGVLNAGTLNVTNSTFSGNSANDSGGGVRVWSGTATLTNTIIANSTNGGDCVKNTSATVSGSNNLIEDSANACNLPTTGNIIGQDPQLGALTGSPAYFPLNSGSLAIDAGDNTTCATNPVNNQSQNGVTRPKDGDNNGTSICDIGSYEAPSLPPVVAVHNLQAAYTGSGPAFFTVTYNKPISNPPGNSGTDDVTNPANYLLIEKGTNALADTLSCAGGVSGDDAQQIVTAVSYNPSTFTATVTLAGALPAGRYRLFVCGTTSIVSLDNTPLNNGSDFVFDFVVTPEVTRLPETGFPLGRVTKVGAPEVAYASTTLVLEIPALGLKAPIVGVPKSGETWDVFWLGNTVGWLEGSAFPTWAGNTVLTAHVWDADNTPGIFYPIKTLKYSDRLYIHAFGQTYVYEVRENRRLSGDRRLAEVFRHEELAWVTLLTCEGYNPLADTYLYRRLVRAVLVEVR